MGAAREARASPSRMSRTVSSPTASPCPRMSAPLWPRMYYVCLSDVFGVAPAVSIMIACAPARRSSRQVQTLTCSASSGTFVLSLGWAATAVLPYSTSPAALALALTQLPTAGGAVRVTTAGSAVVCGGQGVVSTIEYTGVPSASPALAATTAPSAGLVSVSLLHTVRASPRWPRCSSHGHGLTARARARGRQSSFVSYGAIGAPGTWDAAMTHGCMCYPDAGRNSSWSAGVTSTPYPGFAFDSPWGGNACSLRACPLGTDPLASRAAVSEVQRVVCPATSGTVTLTFRDATTTPIAWNAPVDDVVAALQALPTITRVRVVFLDGKFCDASNTGTNVTFLTELGDLPLMTARSSSLGALSVAAITNGYMGAEVCSGRGVCGACARAAGTPLVCLTSFIARVRARADYASGTCTCVHGFSSSDGFGGMGSRGDCGYRVSVFLNK